jgi:hypothetical protein
MGFATSWFGFDISSSKFDWDTRVMEAGALAAGK